MISGIVYKNKPLTQITIAWTLGVQDIITLIDTGFTGELKVSQQKAKELGLKITHTERVLLANEKTTYMGATIALVSLEGITNIVNVLISEGESIIGVGLLKRFNYSLNINFKYDFLELRKIR